MIKESFGLKKVESYQLARLFDELVNRSDEAKNLQDKREFLKSMLKDIIKTRRFKPEVMDLFGKSRRIALYNLSGIKLCGKDFGINLGGPRNIVETFSYKGSEADFPPLLGKGDFWKTAVITPEMIGDKRDIEKIRLVLIECEKARQAKDNFLADYGKGYHFLGGNITFGRLYNLNKEWFNILIEILGIPEDEIYETEAEENQDSFVNAVKKLKEILAT